MDEPSRWSHRHYIIYSHTVEQQTRGFLFFGGVFLVFVFFKKNPFNRDLDRRRPWVEGASDAALSQSRTPRGLTERISAESAGMMVVMMMAFQ